MIMRPRLRKLALVTHVSASVGWLGAVVAFLALAITGAASQDPQTVRSAYLMMEPVGWFVIVPLNLASLVTGLISSLGTTWGLFRHYWVLAKLVINVFATGVLLMYMQTLGYLTGVAADSSADLVALTNGSPILHTGATIPLLLVAVTLAVYKPRGMTRYGQRRQYEQRTRQSDERAAVRSSS
jgi:uncharacterized membrane protein